MVEALDPSISKVCVGLEDKCLARQRVLANCQELIQVEAEHGLCWSLFPEIEVVKGQLADGA
jgi:hypothetical protein